MTLSWFRLIPFLLSLGALLAQASLPPAPPTTASLAPPAQQIGVDCDDDVVEADRADEECTVGVASGKATADGRPLLWKNRDAQVRDNAVRAFADGRFPYVALVNASGGASVWGGANAAGFCIMNSVSRDLPGNSTKGPGNGAFMKLALQRCATVADFEALLGETARSGRRTRANFGVIDAAGGAAIFETGHTTHTRFDADKHKDGILVRANFATTQKGDRGKERFARGETLCHKLPSGQGLDHRYLLQQFCRDLLPPKSAQRGTAGQQDVRETIHRQTTVAAMVFHGVKPDEDPRWTTMWSLLGQPLFTVAVPCWPGAGAVADELRGAPRSALCDAARGLADQFYEPAPQQKEDGAADGEAGENRGEEAEVAGAIRWLRTEGLGELRTELLAAEDAILRVTAAQFATWREEGKGKPPAAAELLAFHRQQAAAALVAVRAAAEQRMPVGAGR